METQRPVFELRLRHSPSGKVEVWDPTRKKYIVLTPEEWVRQQFLLYLTEHLKYPRSLIVVEKGIIYNGLQKRIDLMVSDRQGQPFLLAEFKSPKIALSAEALHQSSLYSYAIGAQYLVLDNHVNTFVWKREGEKGLISVEEVPGAEGL
jgi:hypothetical protein